MKKARKVVVLALCAVLLVAASVMGTLAYLTSTTEKVTNTFTAGNVTITLDEAEVDEYGVAKAGADRVTANKYKLIPGHTYVKDPTIHVGKDSEDCWVFAKLENGLGEDATITIASGWSVVSENTDGSVVVYAYNTKLSANGTAKLFSEFTFAATADPSAYTGKNISITGYALQADGFTSAAAAWEKAPATWSAN